MSAKIPLKAFSVGDTVVLKTGTKPQRVMEAKHHEFFTSKRNAGWWYRVCYVSSLNYKVAGKKFKGVWRHESELRLFTAADAFEQNRMNEWFRWQHQKLKDTDTSGHVNCRSAVTVTCDGDMIAKQLQDPKVKKQIEAVLNEGKLEVSGEIEVEFDASVYEDWVNEGGYCPQNHGKGDENMDNEALVTSTKGKLFETKDGKFGTFLATNSANEMVLEMKGKGELKKFKPSDLTEVKPYTVAMKHMESGEITGFVVKPGSVEEGDLLVRNGTMYLVTKIDTKDDRAGVPREGFMKLSTEAVDL